LCDDPKDPKCQKGIVLTLSASASIALPQIGLGGNAEAGVAVNLKTGFVSAYFHAGPSAGVGGSVSGEVALQGGSLDDVVGHTGNPSANALETEIGTAVSANFVSARWDNPSRLNGGGLSAGPGAGVLFNTTVVAGSSPAVHIKDVLRFGVLPAICGVLGRTC